MGEHCATINPTHVDPEEAFVVSIASCHVRTFLWLVSREGLVVTSYSDERWVYDCERSWVEMGEWGACRWTSRAA
jgi:organic hydroperoxide reductase OsmC/OhrA